jgi:hypothetical protein
LCGHLQHAIVRVMEVSIGWRSCCRLANMISGIVAHTTLSDGSWKHCTVL